ncbi:MAG TPA: ribose 5-phosphate isomerase B [Bacteroidales bacterium]|nr:ribose 5-phosphate isomerase B [Bacteroidales bacterium]HPS16623.1 ribose 5-phosphate isomerase B [Bacteroidales bacterium]
MEKIKEIAIGSDHAGFIYKEKIIEFLKGQGYLVNDLGCYSEASVDYPDFVHPVAIIVEENVNTKGILICGSGNGVCMTANKHQSIRAALCWNEELAKLSRLHNDANIICIPARFIDLDLALKMINIFLTTDFEGGRHFNRVKKIPC